MASRWAVTRPVIMAAAPSHHRRGGTPPRSRCVAHRVLLQAAWPAPVSWPRDHRRRVRSRRFRYQSPQTAPCARVQHGRVSDLINGFAALGYLFGGIPGVRHSKPLLLLSVVSRSVSGLWHYTPLVMWVKRGV